MKQEVLSTWVSNSFYDDCPTKKTEYIDSPAGNWFDDFILENGKYKLVKTNSSLALESAQETYYSLYEKVRFLLFFRKWKEIKYLEEPLIEKVFDEHWNRRKLNEQSSYSS